MAKNGKRLRKALGGLDRDKFYPLERGGRRW